MQAWYQLSRWNRGLSLLFCSFALLSLCVDVFMFVYHPVWAKPIPTQGFMFVLGLCFLLFAISANPTSYQAPFSFKLKDFVAWTKWIALLGVTFLLMAWPISFFWPHW